MDIHNIDKYFNCKMSGSFILYRNNLLDLQDISDIDVYFESFESYYKFFDFLKDEGYSPYEKINKKGIVYEIQDKYNNITSSVYMIKDEQLPIHMNFIDSYETRKQIGETNTDILIRKLQRGTKKDYMHIIKCCQKICDNIKD